VFFQFLCTHAQTDRETLLKQYLFRQHGGERMSSFSTALFNVFRWCGRADKRGWRWGYLAAIKHK